MCGLVATLSAGAPVEEAPHRRALGALRHRGPDGEGLLLTPDRRVALGHVRLALVDRAGGAQPIASRCPAGDGLVAVVTGELYDDDRLRAALVARGHRFATRSDSEILLHLYEERGDDALDELRGEFAFVLWDAQRRRLLAARDRFGVRPLCWTLRRDGHRASAIHLATEAKGLFALGVRAAFDEESLAQSLALQYAPPDRTLFRDVRQLAPGTLLAATLDGGDGLTVETRRWWRLPARRPHDEAPTREEAAARVFDALDEAVAVRLRGEVPVACHLSGGIDSSAVAALAARRCARPLDCFTISFADGGAHDEAPIARATAAHLGAALHVVSVDDAALADALPSAVFHGEGLGINGHYPAKWLLARAVAAAGYRVALTGEGSDELLAGYPHVRRDLFRARAAAGDDDAARRLALLDGTNAVSAGVMLPVAGATDEECPPIPLDAARRRLGHLPSWLEAKGDLGGRVFTLLDGDARRRFAPERAAERFLDRAAAGVPPLATLSPVEQTIHLWTETALAGYILRTLGDGMEMASAVEGRLPFLDHRVAATAQSLPIERLVDEGVEKRPLREAVRALLPPAIVTREKQPFIAPPLFARPGGPSPRWRSLAEDLLVGPARPSFVDGAAVARQLAVLPSLPRARQQATEPALFLLVTAALLADRFAL